MLATISGSPAAAQVSVTLQPPARDFGYFPGDLLTGTAVIVLGPDTILDARSLPPAGPVSGSMDVRRVEVSRAADGRRVEVRVTYQTFFSPEQVLRADIPGYALAFAQAGHRLTAAVPGFSVAVSPFRHDLQPVLDPAALRPDHAALSADTGTALRDLLAGAALAALAGLILLVPGFDRRRGPFARAARQLARLPPDGAAPDGLLVLHRAFDATAGRRLFADDLDVFLDGHPRFAPLRTEIAGFFAASRDAFFGAGAAPDRPWLVRLGGELVRAERR